jgi:hypothetical protein
MASSSTQTLTLERLCLEPPRLPERSPTPVIPSDGPSFDNGPEVQTDLNQCGFDSYITNMCDLVAQSLYPDVEIQPVQSQGRCSYTVAVSTTHLLQFRPAPYQLDIRVYEEARRIFGNLVPRIQYLGCVPDGISERQLHMYIQQRIPGVTLDEFRRMNSHDDETQRECLKRLVGDLAEVFAISLHHARPASTSEETSFEKGLVGRSLRWRLHILRELPDRYLREQVDQVTAYIDKIEALPWCLTHGDLIPANIMVDPESGRLTGLIDWAEGEWLPFGVGLYGLEEVLLCCGDELETLRDVFWSRFAELVDTDAARKSWGLDVGVPRTLGILLWRGMAFEAGRIDRVVEEGRDDEELWKLRLFLGAPRSSLGDQGAARCVCL